MQSQVRGIVWAKMWAIMSEDLKTSDNHNNWFEYAKSHLAHIMLGTLSAGVAAYVYFVTYGELPYKWALGATMIALWALYEIGTQWRARGWGNFEDWIFLGVYGSAGIVIVAREITVGETGLMIDLALALRVYSIPTAHLLAGVMVRVWREAKKNAGV